MWNEKTTFVVDTRDTTLQLRIDLYDKDMVKKNDFLGAVAPINPADLPLNHIEHANYVLRGKKKGRHCGWLHIGFCTRPARAPGRPLVPPPHVASPG